jgi:hypothetical protein
MQFVIKSNTKAALFIVTPPMTDSVAVHMNECGGCLRTTHRCMLDRAESVGGSYGALRLLLTLLTWLLYLVNMNTDTCQRLCAFIAAVLFGI